MAPRVLYLGDTSLNGAAGYLAGVMTHSGIEFDYHASDERFCDDWLQVGYEAVILSDYPSANLDETQIDRLIEAVQGGMGLLMIGGWESFTGLGGDYGQTRLSGVLPVLMQETDDRMNNSGPCIVARDVGHPIVKDLPFDDDAPVVGGFNALQAKPQGITVLSVHMFGASRAADHLEFQPQKTYPLLVVARHGQGNVAAFASDVAPHWVGGLVDWGKDRVEAQAPKGPAVEVGSDYTKLFTNMIRWVSTGSV